MNNQDASALPGLSYLSMLFILSALMAFTSLSTDVYLSAMPAMSDDLQGNVELTITGFLAGFAIAQLVWGPVSDRIGRKKPLYIGMLLFIAGSAGCALSQSITEIVCWRVFQAIGACTAPMLARAIVRDTFDRTEAAHTLTTLMMIMAIAPIGGPILGGIIVHHASWHWIFWLLTATGVVMFLALFRLPETHPPEKRITAPLSHAFGHYATLFKNKTFMQLTLCLTCFYVSAYAFITGSPHVYIRFFDVSPDLYGWLFAINVVGIVGIGFLNRKLVKIWSLEKLLMIAVSVAAVAMITLGIGAAFFNPSLPFVMITVFVFFSMNGIIAACATTAALDLVPQLAGSGSALIGSLQYGSGIVSSLLLAYAGSETPVPMAIIMAVFTCASAAFLFTGTLRAGEQKPDA